MIIRNHTPHKLNFYNDKHEMVYSVDSIGVIRAQQEPYVLDKVLEAEYFKNAKVSIPVIKPTFYGRPDFVPAAEPDTIFVVSQIAAQSIKDYYPERTDFYIVAETLRNRQGEIIGCKSLTSL